MRFINITRVYDFLQVLITKRSYPTKVTKIIQIMPLYRLNELIQVTYTYMYILLKIPIIYPSNRVKISGILIDT
jgi:hypothetical protein